MHQWIRTWIYRFNWVFLFSYLALCGCTGTPQSSTSSSSSSSSGGTNAALTCPSSEDRAFNRTAHLIPGKFEAEDFDPIEGVPQSPNPGYRRDSPVPLWQQADEGSFALAARNQYTRFNFTLQVQQAGTYEVFIRATASGLGRSLALEQCDQTLLSNIAVPVTNGSQGVREFKTIKVGSIKLAAGTQLITLRFANTADALVNWVHIGPYSGPVDSPDWVNNSSTSSGDKNPAFFVGNTGLAKTVRSGFASDWQQISAQFGTTWGSVEGYRSSYNWSYIDTYYQYAKENHLIFHQAAMVWGAQNPAWINGINTAEIAQELEDWLALFCTRYPDADMITVVNEPSPDHQPANYAKKAFGDDWIRKSFELARTNCPNSVLMVNDYFLLDKPLDEFAALISPAVQAGLVDAIGIDATAIEALSVQTISQALDAIWNKFHLPMYITGYAIRGTDEIQLSIVREQFPIFYNHPHVRGISFGSDLEGETYLTTSELIKKDRTPRPAMMWLREYLKANPKNP